MGIIDFRVRPLWDGYRQMAENGTTDRFLNALGFSASPSIRERSISLLLSEMDASGVDIAIVPGRQSKATFVNNEALFCLQEQYPERFIVFPLYAPDVPHSDSRQMEQWIAEGLAKGVTIEPGFGNTLRFDDEAYFPLYELLSNKKIPLLTTFSGSIPEYIDSTLPERLHRIAKLFPDMNIIVGHGGWPWVRELICMAFFTPNLYLAPDLYATHCAGSEDYKQAASYMLRDRMLFGSSYPLVPIGDAVQCAKQWQLIPAAQDAYFYKNAARLLGLEKDTRFSMTQDISEKRMEKNCEEEL